MTAKLFTCLALLGIATIISASEPPRVLEPIKGTEPAPKTPTAAEPPLLEPMPTPKTPVLEKLPAPPPVTKIVDAIPAPTLKVGDKLAPDRRPKPKAPMQTATLTKIAPLTTPTGKIIDLQAGYKGKVILVHFTSTSRCDCELGPELQPIVAAMHKHQNLAVIIVNFDNNAAIAKDTLDHYFKASTPVLLVMDADHRNQTAQAVPRVPFDILATPDGIRLWQGDYSSTAFSSMIQRHLQPGSATQQRK